MSGRTLDIAELLYPWTGVLAAQALDADLRVAREACPSMDEDTFKLLVLAVVDGARLAHAKGSGTHVE
jgi:hypothetical protein